MNKRQKKKKFKQDREAAAEYDTYPCECCGEICCEKAEDIGVWFARESKPGGLLADD